MPFSINPNSYVALRWQEHWWWYNRDTERDLASDQSSVNDWHNLQAARRSEEWSATYRKKVAAETVFDRRALQFERACNRLSVVWLYRGLNASPKRNVARIIGSAGAGRGMHRLHRNGGWLRGTTRDKLLIKSMCVTARSVDHCVGGTLSRSVSLPDFTSTEQTSYRTEWQLPSFKRLATIQKQNDIKHPPHGHCVLCIK